MAQPKKRSHYSRTLSHYLKTIVRATAHILNLKREGLLCLTRGTGNSKWNIAQGGL